MNRYVIPLRQATATSLPFVGGKGANLGELMQARFAVPDGFCVSTEAYRDFMKNCPHASEQIDSLSRLSPDDLGAIRSYGETLRSALYQTSIPTDICNEIIQALEPFDEKVTFAVRSSATAEDLPSASFAGQQDTFLNVQVQGIVAAVRKCWASLFTDRAIAYRLRNGFDSNSLALAVVVQRMIFPEASGILFTADPLSGHREIVSIDAGFGLGEGLVSGLISADNYRVRNGSIVDKRIEEKTAVVQAMPAGGTALCDLGADRRKAQVLPDDQIIALADIGKRIEAHFGCPQDVEWCSFGTDFFITQSRPITTLHPLPDNPENKYKIYYSFSHVQMMMEAMSPVSRDLWRLLVPMGRNASNLYSTFIREAGCRLFIDMTPLIMWSKTRKYFVSQISDMDELMADALQKAMNSDDCREGKRDYKHPGLEVFRLFKSLLPIYMMLLPRLVSYLFFAKPSDIPKHSFEKLDKAVERSIQDLLSLPHSERPKAVEQSMGNMIRRIVDFFTGVPIGYYIVKPMQKRYRRWVGEDLDMDALNKSLPYNVTSELGLLLGDLADIARPFPDLIRYLEQAKDDGFYEGLEEMEGGRVFRHAFEAFISRYGMRCAGEIELSKVRWSEAPTMVIPAILGHLYSNEPGEHRKKFEQGKAEANTYITKALEKLSLARFGKRRANKMERMIHLYRNTAGLREFPKYALVRVFGVYRQILLQEGHSMQARGMIEAADDIFYLHLRELSEIWAGRFAEPIQTIIAARQAERTRFQTMTPPRVMSSLGEQFVGRKTLEHAPKGAFIGVGVSSGIAEGTVRIVFDPDKAMLRKGEILVAPFTDPGWTPLFHSAVAIVVEVGGMMTHGSVVAREYGIPAVVGIDKITSLLKTGQRIRVNGNMGYIELIECESTHDEML